MSRHYESFKTVVYIPAWTASSISEKRLEEEYSFIEKYVGLDKVYLETHRGDIDVEREDRRDVPVVCIYRLTRHIPQALRSC